MNGGGGGGGGGGGESAPITQTNVALTVSITVVKKLQFTEDIVFIFYVFHFKSVQLGKFDQTITDQSLTITSSAHSRRNDHYRPLERIFRMENMACFSADSGA